MFGAANPSVFQPGLIGINGDGTSPFSPQVVVSHLPLGPSLKVTADSKLDAIQPITTNADVDFNTVDANVIGNVSGSAATVTAANQAAITTLPNVVSLNSCTISPNAVTATSGFTGPLTGNVTGNCTGTAASVTGATQNAITTLPNVVSLNSCTIAPNAITASSGFTGNLTGNCTGSAATVTGATQNAITSCPNLVAVGTVTSGTWNGTTIAINRGGTGQTSTPTDGQLLIGKTSTGGFSLATLTNGTAITVSNGSGSITITNAGVTALTGTANQVTVSASTGSVTLSLPQSIATSSTVQFGKILVGTATPPTPTYAVDANVASANQSNVALTGNSLDGSTSTDGISLSLSHNAAGNRQLFVGDTAKLTSSSTNYGVRILPDPPRVDAISTDGTVIQLNLGSAVGCLMNATTTTNDILPVSNATKNIGASGTKYLQIYCNQLNVTTIASPAGLTLQPTTGSTLDIAPNIASQVNIGFNATSAIPIVVYPVISTVGAPLQDSGKIYLKGGYYSGGTNNDIDMAISNHVTATGASRLYFQNNSGTVLYYIDQVGHHNIPLDLSVGTSNAPNYPLDVWGSGIIIRAWAASGDSRITCGSPTANWSWSNGAAGASKFSLIEEGYSDRLTIIPGGNVGIAKTSPGTVLDVAGTTTTTNLVATGLLETTGSNWSTKFDCYSEDTYSVTWTGAISHTLSTGVRATRLGRMVVVFLLGPNDTAVASTNIASNAAVLGTKYRPSTNAYCMMPHILKNGLQQTGLCVIGTNGFISIYPTADTNSTFLNALQAGWDDCYVTFTV